MAEIWFAIKSFLAALTILWLLQIRIGAETLENKAEAWIEASQTVNYVKEAASGAIELTQVGIAKVMVWASKQQQSVSEKSEK